MIKARIKTSDLPISPFYSVKLHSFFDAAFTTVGLYALTGLNWFKLLDVPQGSNRKILESSFEESRIFQFVCIKIIGDSRLSLTIPAAEERKSLFTDSHRRLIKPGKYLQVAIHL